MEVWETLYPIAVILSFKCDKHLLSLLINNITFLPLTGHCQLFQLPGVRGQRWQHDHRVHGEGRGRGAGQGAQDVRGMIILIVRFHNLQRLRNLQMFVF